MIDPKWTTIVLLDESEDEGCEFQLFLSEEDAHAYTRAEGPHHIGGDVAFGEGSSWTEFGPTKGDDNILAECRDVVPWKTKEAFYSWVSTLNRVTF